MAPSTTNAVPEQDLAPATIYRPRTITLDTGAATALSAVTIWDRD